MDADGQREQLFVQIGLQQRLFARNQLDDARAAQAGRGGKGTLALGEALVAVGALSPEQLRGLERAVTYRVGREEDKRIARIIVESGYCSEEAVERALTRQKDLYARTGDLLRLCTLLMDSGSITDSQHVAARKIFQIEMATEQRPG